MQTEFLHYAQRRHGQGLGLAAGEERRTVDTGQYPRLAGDGAQLVHGPAVDANPLVDDDGAHDVLDAPVDACGDVLPLVGKRL